MGTCKCGASLDCSTGFLRIMFICISIYSICIYIYLHIHTYIHTYIYIYPCIYLSIYLSIYLYIHIGGLTHVFIYIYVHMFVHTYVYIYIYMRKCVCDQHLQMRCKLGLRYWFVAHDVRSLRGCECRCLCVVARTVLAWKKNRNKGLETA